MPKDKEILRGLAENEALFLATKELVLSHFAEVPYAEGASDELLGQITRAYHIGRKKVEEAFAEISRCKVIPPIKEKDSVGY